MEERQTHPRCKGCGREFSPGTSWTDGNSCRVAYLLPIIAEHPDVSAWELANFAGMAYPDTNKAMAKARETGRFARVLEWRPEDREGGGIRYRFTAKPGWGVAVQEWIALDRERQSSRLRRW